jgi:ADP-ribosylglycohydrolase
MSKTGHLKNASLGCLFGACVGDAAGATLEGIGRKPTMPEVNRAMMMTGGGKWKVAPGQITDDGELTLCLAQALGESAVFQIENIAEKYNDWAGSRPFDMGMTIHRSIGCYKGETSIRTKGYAGIMAEAAEWRCTLSKANGSLMRISPLGIWGHKLSDDKLAEFAQADSRLSHPNPSCLHAVSCYVITIANLLRDFGDREKAFDRAEKWANSNANEEVKSWLRDAKNNSDVPYHPQAGFVKIGFTHAFRHLLLGTGYAEAVKETLAGGGDTDTNACIVGGLVGAADGADAIPEHMKKAVLNCDTHKSIHPRPEFLHTTQIPDLVKGLIAQ